MGLHLIINTMPGKKGRLSTLVVKSFAGVMQTFLYLKTYFEIKTKSVYGKICQEFKKGRSTDPVLALYADTSFIIWIA